MKRYEYNTEVLGKTIEAEIIDTGAGITVTIAGGDKGHIGAVAVKYPEEPLISHQFPTHREGVVADKWALALEDALKVPVAVSAGVHYDGIGKDEIVQILHALDDMLGEVASAFSRK